MGRFAPLGFAACYQRDARMFKQKSERFKKMRCLILIEELVRASLLTLFQQYQTFILVKNKAVRGLSSFEIVESGQYCPLVKKKLFYNIFIPSLNQS